MTAPSLLDSSIAYFADVKKRDGKNIPLRAVLSDIQGGWLQSEIEHLRQLNGSEYTDTKKKLPAVMLSGTSRNGGHKETDIGVYSGLLQIDVDKLADIEAASALRDRLFTDKHILACWLSPGGNGVKAVVRVRPELSLHRASFQAVRKHFLDAFKCEIDSTCSDPTRLCFLSFDPALKQREDADILEPLPVPVSVAPRAKVNATKRQAPSQSPSPQPLTTTPYSSQSSETSILYTEPLRDFPILEAHYQKLIGNQYSGIQPGHRNQALKEIVPFLMVAIHPRFIPVFTEKFYHQYVKLFRDPLEQHQSEARFHLDACLKRYFAGLMPDERVMYLDMDEDHRAAYRICRSFASLEKPGEPQPPQFYLSAHQLGGRLAMWDRQADSIIKDLCQLQAMKMVTKGMQWRKGEQHVASRYEWLLTLEPRNPAGNLKALPCQPHEGLSSHLPLLPYP